MQGYQLQLGRTEGLQRVSNRYWAGLVVRQLRSIRLVVAGTARLHADMECLRFARSAQEERESLETRLELQLAL